MINDVAFAILEYGLEWKQESPEALCSENHKCDNTTLHTWIDGQPTYIPNVQQLQILGDCIDTHGNTINSKNHRLANAEKVFGRVTAP